VTFPDGWVVGIDPMEPGTASPDGTSTESVFMAAYGWAPDGGTQCLITNEPLGDPPGDPSTALEESADWALSHYESMLVETSSLDLPAGPAIRHVVESEGTVGAAYLFSDGFELFFLSCFGDRPSDDHWLSIAETFEFMPAEAVLPDGAGRLPIEAICATYQAVATNDQPVTPEILEQTRIIVENRVNATGVAEPIVVTQGEDRISVELPGVEDEADIRNLIGTTGVLEFMPVPPELQGLVGENNLATLLKSGALPLENREVDFGACEGLGSP
jgi:hypothetical protein